MKTIYQTRILIVSILIVFITILPGWVISPATLTRIDLNDAPVLSAIEATPLAYTENGAPKVITTKITVKDADDKNLRSAIVWISDNYQSGKDILIFTDNLGITGTWYAETGMLNLVGSSSVANYQSALRSIKYFNNSDDPSVLARKVSFIVNDGSANSNIVTRQVRVTAANDAPVLSNIETSSLRYTENDTNAYVTGTLRITDEDDLNLESAVVRISDNYQIGQDILTFKNTSSITGVWNSGTGILNLNGASSVDSYQEALHSITYFNTSDKPSALTRTISFRVNDGSANSATVLRQVTVTPVDDTPLLSDIEPIPLEYSENAPAVLVTGTIKVTDADDINIESAVVSISSNYQNGEDLLSFINNSGISGSWNSNSGIMILTGRSSIVNYQAALRSITYSNKSDNPHLIPRIVSFTVNDGDIDSPAATREISLIPVNDEPVLSNIETDLLPFTENDTPKNITIKVEVSDADDVNLDSAHVWISRNYLDGQDILSFSNTNAISGTWDPENGLFCLAGSSSLADYQDALRSVTYYNSSDNPSVLIRTVSLAVYDGDLSGKIVTRQIAIIPVNDAPTADAVNLHGSMIIDSTLTGSYIYSDAESDPEGASRFRWFRADDFEGTNETVISGATARTYLLSAADSGKYICFEVQPVATSGTTPGTAVRSPRQRVLKIPSGWVLKQSDFIYSGNVTAIVFRIVGEEAESGLLAAFAGEECRGIAWPVYNAASDHYIFKLICFSNKISGDVLIFRYYDPDENKIFNMDRSVDFVAGMNAGSDEIPIKMNVGVDYNITFQEGWNWFSVNTFLDNMTLSFILSSPATTGDYIKSQTGSAAYYEEYGWFGSLQQIEPSILFKIMVQDSCGIKFTGRPVDLSAIHIPLVSGWNWNGYLPQVPLPVDAALSSLSLVNLDYIKNQTKSATYYEGFGWFGSLDMLYPGEGYMIRLTNPGILTYPDPGKKDGKITLPENEGIQFNTNSYEFNGSVSAKILIDGLPGGSEKDLLFAYVNDEIRGIATGDYFEPQQTYIYSLMIFSNISQGENITFAYFDTENNRFYNCTDSVIFSSDMIIADAFRPYELNFYSHQKKRVGHSGEEFLLFTYPNPFRQSLNIDYNLPYSDRVRITVCDPTGNPVRLLLDQHQESGHYTVEWMTNSEPSGLYIIILQAGKRLRSKKVILMPNL